MYKKCTRALEINTVQSEISITSTSEGLAFLFSGCRAGDEAGLFTADADGVEEPVLAVVRAGTGTCEITWRPWADVVAVAGLLETCSWELELVADELAEAEAIDANAPRRASSIKLMPVEVTRALGAGVCFGGGFPAEGGVRVS